MLSPSRFADWLHERVFQPNIVVIGTETAKRQVRQSCGLSLAELFSPFGGEYARIPVQYQSLEKQIRCDARFRFSDSESTTQWTTAQAERVAGSVVETHSPSAPHNRRFGQPMPGPWFEQWRLAMFRSLRWSEHEGLDQPTAALLVASSKEAELTVLFEQLLHSSNMPPLCTQGVLDPVPGRAALIIHDYSDPDSPSLQELDLKLETVRARFAPHLCLSLRINSAADASAEVQALFRQHVALRLKDEVKPPPPGAAPPPAAEPDPPLVPRLGPDDLRELSRVLAEVVVKSAVPWMQTQLHQLHSQVNQERSGLRNKIKAFWRRPKEGGAEVALATYPLSSVEGQVRLAADIALLVRDYDVALSLYKLVVNDFKQDQAWKHAAGAYEMWGICLYITGKGEWQEKMKEAYKHYRECGAGRHAMRTVSLQLAMKCDPQAVAQQLMDVNGHMSEAGLRSALMLEQAAQLYQLGGRRRKGAFHMVLAGHSFNKLQFKRLALSCYSAVVGSYEGKRWFHIVDHLHFSMARQAFGLGLLPESVSHFVLLLNSFNVEQKRTSVQADRENIYLKEFLFVERNFRQAQPADAPRADLGLLVPAIGQDVLVVLADERDDTEVVSSSEPPASPTKDARNVAEQLAAVEDRAPPPPLPWEQLGQRLTRVLAPDEKQELLWRNDRHGNASRVFETLQRVAPAGAEVAIEVKLTNPLLLKLELHHARLSGELVVPIDAEQEPGAEPPVEFQAQNITLEPRESKRVRFGVLPKREGLLKIKSLTWDLMDQVHCERQLAIKGRRLRATVEQRAAPDGAYSVDRRLELRVRRGVPRAWARLESWPDASPLLLGEVRTCALVVGCKDGPGQPQSLRITTSHPTFIAFPDPPAEPGVSVATDPQGVLVRTGALAGEVRLPFVLRADAVGRHVVRMLVLAEADLEGVTGPKSEHRAWVSLEERLNVQPSLSCSVVQNSSYQEAGRSVFSVTLENRCQQQLEVGRLRCALPGTPGVELGLEECVRGGARHRPTPGQLLHLLFALDRGAEPQPEADREEVEVPSTSGLGDEAVIRRKARQILLSSARAASAASSKSGRFDAAAQRMDLVVEWSAPGVAGAGRSGELFVLRVPRERPSTSPCPLSMHLLAPEEARLEDGQPAIVPVTLQVQNSAAVGDLSFFYTAEPVQDFAWLGCETSEVIRLSPLQSHTATLHALFPAPGVFNLNRLRFSVVGMSNGAVPATEQAPVAFTFPYERLVRIMA